MRKDGNYGLTLGYGPNRFGEWQEQTEYKEPPPDLQVHGSAENCCEDHSDYYWAA